MIHYFKKELVSNPIKDRKGAVIHFEDLGGNSGVLALNSETQTDLIADLTAIKGTRGVSIIDQGVYEWLKKNRPKSDSSVSSSPPNGMPALRVLHRLSEAASPAVPDDPALRSVPQQPAVVAPAPSKPSLAIKTAPDQVVSPVPPAKSPNLGVPKPAAAAAAAT